MPDHSNKLVDQSEALDSFFESLMRDVEAYEENGEDNEAKKNEIKERAKGQDESTLQTIDQVSGVEEDNANSKGAAPVAQPTLVSETKQQPTKKVVPARSLKEKTGDTSIFETLPQIAPAEVSSPPVEMPQVEASSATESEVVATEQVVTIQEPEQEPLGKPEWAEADFQVMLFKVVGLTLAVPLIELNGVVECNLSDVTSMPGHADFYLGLLNYLDKSVPLVDTARFVLPPDKLNILAAGAPEERITRVVMIQDCQYGLACDEVNEVITLSPESVRWRSQRTQRRWLAGTVVEHMCALIDANAFAELLASRTPIQDFRD